MFHQLDFATALSRGLQVVQLTARLWRHIETFGFENRVDTSSVFRVKDVPEGVR